MDRRSGRTILICLFLMSTMEAKHVYEGDLILSKEQYDRVIYGSSSTARGFTTGTAWPNGVIPYKFDAGIAGSSSAKSEILNAINEWQSKTCIKFVEATSSDAEYITFVKDGNNRCAATGLGFYKGYAYRVLLAERCWYQGMIVHELGHVIGFKHEQNRPDRDNYVTIKWENIKDGRDRDFHKYSTSDANAYITPYDYGSIMHYGPAFASKNDEDTIVPKQSGVTMGDWKYLTEKDIMQLQVHYNCPGKYEFNKIICQDSTQSIKCFGGRKIKITYADYGRQNMVKCSFTPWVTCSSNQLSKVSAMCDGLSQCDVKASDSIFGDPCWLISKYLEVRYKCVL